MRLLQYQIGRQLAAQLARDGDPLALLRTAQATCRDRRLDTALAQTIREVERGADLTSAIERQQVLPKPFVAALQTHDHAVLETVADAATEVFHHRARLRAALLSAAFLLSILFIAVTVGVQLAFPKIQGFIDTQGVEPSALWSISSVLLLWFCGPVGGALLVGLFYLIWSRTDWLEALLFRAGAQTLPYRAAAARTLAAMLRADVSVERALEVSGEVSGHRRVAQRFRTATARAAGGAPVADALNHTGLLPRSFARIWAVDPVNMASATAEVLEAEAKAHRGTLVTAVRTRYALAAGILVLWVGATLMSAVAGVYQ